jgi:hypothetical protein
LVQGQQKKKKSLLHDGVYWEKQKSADCLLHSLNSFFGHNFLNQMDMNVHAHKFDAKQKKVLGAVFETDGATNWSVNTLQELAQTHFKTEDGSKQEFERVCQLEARQDPPVDLNLVRRFLVHLPSKKNPREGHWIAMVRGRKGWWDTNSLNDGPRSVEANTLPDLRTYLKGAYTKKYVGANAEFFALPHDPIQHIQDDTGEDGGRSQVK